MSNIEGFDSKGLVVPTEDLPKRLNSVKEILFPLVDQCSEVFQENFSRAIRDLEHSLKDYKAVNLPVCLPDGLGNFLEVFNYPDLFHCKLVFEPADLVIGRLPGCDEMEILLEVKNCENYLFIKFGNITRDSGTNISDAEFISVMVKKEGLIDEDFACAVANRHFRHWKELKFEVYGNEEGCIVVDRMYQNDQGQSIVSVLRMQKIEVGGHQSLLAFDTSEAFQYQLDDWHEEL